MKQVAYSLLLGLLVFISSCNNSQNEALVNAERERDSLFEINSQQQTLLNDMTSKMAEIKTSLDSIAFQEEIIVRRVDEFGVPLSRENLKERLTILAEYIGELRSKISSMESDLSSDKAVITQLKGIIEYLNATLEEKDAEIQSLKEELDNKNFNIALLRKHVTHLRDTVENVQKEKEEQRQENEEQRKRIIQQEKSLNEVYYVIGTKNHLVESGVLTKSGLLKKTRINFESIDKTDLTKADIRTLKTITITGRSPKILSQEPKDSYTLVGSEGQYVLTIVNPEQFWSTNNRILVVQIK